MIEPAYTGSYMDSHAGSRSSSAWIGSVCRSGARSDQLTTHSNVPDFSAILVAGNSAVCICTVARMIPAS